MKKVVKFFGFGVAIGLLIYLYFFTAVPSYFTQESITAVVNQFGIFGPVVFMLIYIVALLILLPATLFSILAGLLFGTVLGTAYVVIAATIAAVIGFVVARYFRGQGDFKNPLVAKMVDKIEEQFDKNGLQTFIILRFLYLPYMPLSYAAGCVKKAKLRDFTIGTFLTNIIGSFVFVYLGGQLTQGWKALLLPVTLIVFTLALPKVVRKAFYKKPIEE